jgi:hypothetical protein
MLLPAAIEGWNDRYCTSRLLKLRFMARNIRVQPNTGRFT